MKRFLLSAAALAMSGGMAAAEYKITILHTNDIHSRIESINKYDSTCNAEGETEGKWRDGADQIRS